MRQEACPHMVWRWRPGGWNPNWTACWIDTFAAPPISDWPNIYAMNSPTCLLFCAVFAERAIRLMALVRKTWGGNRTANGARTHQILASVLRTCWQQGKHAFAELVNLLRSPGPMLLGIIPPTPSP